MRQRKKAPLPMSTVCVFPSIGSSHESSNDADIYESVLAEDQIVRSPFPCPVLQQALIAHVTARLPSARQQRANNRYVWRSVQYRLDGVFSLISEPVKTVIHWISCRESVLLQRRSQMRQPCVIMEVCKNGCAAVRTDDHRSISVNHWVD